MQPRTYQPKQNIQPQNKFKITILAATIFLIGVLIIGILGALGFFHKNPYGPEIKIDDFSNYYKNVPTSVRDSIFALLYSTASLNTNDTQNLNNATATVINPQELKNTYNTETDVHTGNFNVNLSTIQQNFNIQFGWSEDEDNPNINIGNSVTITCLRDNKTSDQSTPCFDAFTSLNIQKLFIDNPILSKLPINISYYTNNYSKYINYLINYEINSDETEFTIIITDYTGGNRANALNEIRNLGYDPSDYTIEYKDESTEQGPGRVPESDIMPGI